jgi:hypothetical protein
MKPPSPGECLVCAMQFGLDLAGKHRQAAILVPVHTPPIGHDDGGGVERLLTRGVARLELIDDIDDHGKKRGRVGKA